MKTGPGDDSTLRHIVPIKCLKLSEVIDNELMRPNNAFELPIKILPWTQCVLIPHKEIAKPHS